VSSFIIRRLIQVVIVVIIVSMMTFLLLQLSPGDPALIMLGENATKEQLEALRKEMWLDQPLYIQYGHWMNNLLHGDLGKSILYRESVSGLIARRLPVTLHLSLIAMVIGTFLGIAVGIICAVRRGSILDNMISLFANIGIAIPVFWLGILGVYFLGLQLNWLPIQGYTSPFTDFGKSTMQSIMPIFCLSVPTIAILARQTRSSMLEVIRQDYIRTAWAKGLNEKVVVFKHAVKNGMIPVVTLIGFQVRLLFGGSVLVEQVFMVPGMGRLLVEGALAKDYIIVQGGVLVTTLMICLANLLVDISYGWLDPRIRYE
jgi:peptide/nickel transport system permease protein